MPSQNRKPITKTMRFEVFKRDGFTCQYCGRKPPEVTLACDHIHPVSEGGENVLENLITACRDCNAGKGKRMMEDIVVRPDADLMLAEVQQEISELRAYQEAAAFREQVREETVEILQNIWIETSGLDWSPASKVLRQMMARYELQVIEDAVIDVAAKVGGGYLRDKGDAWLRYLWAVARNLAASFDDEVA